MSSSQHPIENSNRLQDKENKHEDSKQDQHEYEYNIDTNNTSQSQTNTLSHSWLSIKQLLNSTNLHSHTHLPLLFIHLFKHIFFNFSLQTQLCLTSLLLGSTLIFFSLPHKIIIGSILLFLGTFGVIFIITQKYIHFAQQRGLISLINPGFIKRFILHGSIVDIFWEIRNSKLGIPDFLLSQILPLDEPEREMIFERLPEITRDVVSTEGLIYLTPHAVQNLVLPTHLQRNRNILTDIDRLSPITGSPAHSSHVQHNDSPNERSLRDGILQQTTEDNSSSVTMSSKVDDTKRGFESMGRNWLWQHQKIDKIGTAMAPSSVIESKSSDSSNSSHAYDEKKDIIDEEYQITNVIDDSQTETLSVHNSGSGGGGNEVTWIGQVSKLFSERMLGRNTSTSAKPIIAAVIDTRMKELALQLISYVWKSPFASITDSQLLIIFVCCVGIISFYVTKNKEIRRKFVKSMKFMGIMALFWVGILCFIELNVRRKSKLFNKIFDYINKQLFHSKHHVAVRQRKKSHDLLKKSKLKRMSIYAERSRSRANLLDQLGMRRLAKTDKKSKFSRTMPFLQPTESPKSNPASVSSSSSSSSSEESNDNKRSSLLQIPSNNVLRKRASSTVY